VVAVVDGADLRKGEGGGWTGGGGAKDEGKDAEPDAKPKKRRPRRAYDEEEHEHGGAKGGDAKDARGGDRSPRVRKHVEEGWGVGAPERKSRFNDGDGDGDDDDGRGGGGDHGGSRRRTMADDSGAGDETTEILIIPDLDEQLEEDITLQVAEAPRNRSRRPPPLHELDAELVVTPSAASPAARAGGSAAAKAGAPRRIDLSALSCRLVPPALVDEDDEPWHFDTLLQAVTQEFVADAEVDAALKAETAAAAAAAADDEPERAGPKRRVLGGRRAERPVEEPAAPAAPRDRGSRPPGGRRASRAKAAAPDDAAAAAPPEPKRAETKAGDDSDDDDIGAGAK